MVKRKDDKLIYAFLATFLGIIGFILVLILRKKDKYVMHYAKQSLVIFLIGVIAGVLQMFFSWIPIIGWIIKLALNLLILGLWIISWVYALSGEMKDIPFVADYSEKLKF